MRGLNCLRARGDPPQLQYKGHRAHYRVAWIGQKGTCWEGIVGLEGLEGAKFLFVEHLPGASFAALGSEADSYVEPAAAVEVDHAAVERREAERRQEQRRTDERRKHPRFNCPGTARIWENGQERAVNGRLNEMSLGGCYVEVMSPMRVGAALRMELAVSGRTMRVEGIVRTSQPTFGMGVQFTTLAPSEWERLRRTIGELSGAVAPEEPPQQKLEIPNIPGKELGEALLRWFGSHDTLTRQDFLNLMEHLKDAAEEFTHA